MGKGDRKTKKGKRYRNSYGKSRRSKRNSLCIPPAKLKRWSVERLFGFIGFFDFTTSISFKSGSESYNKFGRSITGTLHFPKKRRKQLNTKLNAGVKFETFGNVQFIEINKDDMTNEQIKILRKVGFHCRDIETVDYYPIQYFAQPSKFENKELPKPLEILIKNDDNIRGAYELEYITYNLQVRDGKELIYPEIVRYKSLQRILNKTKTNDKYHIEDFTENDVYPNPRQLMTEI